MMMNWKCKKCGREVPNGRECPAHLGVRGMTFILIGTVLLAFAVMGLKAQDVKVAPEPTKTACEKDSSYVDTKNGTTYKCRDGKWIPLEPGPVPGKVLDMSAPVPPLGITKDDQITLLSLKADALSADSNLSRAISAVYEAQTKQKDAIAKFQAAIEAKEKQAGCKLDEKFQCVKIADAH
jgi:hypothetical protein